MVTTELPARVDELIREYLAVGCPCRFPRFCAVTARNTRGAGGGSFWSEDQRELIRGFERNVPIVAKRALERMEAPSEGLWLANCGVCDSELRRSYEEFSPGGYVEWLVIRRAPGVEPLGAPVEPGRVYRCRPFASPGAFMAGMVKAAQQFPFVEEDEWFEWLRARAT